MIPSFGYGSYRLNKESIEQTLPIAVYYGYKHIDTAALYRNQKHISTTLKSHEIDRDSMWITSKIDTFSIRDGVATCHKSIQTSFRDLDTSYINLMLLHSSVDNNKNINAWRVLEEYHKKGIIKNIGVSNYNEHNLQYILNNCVIKPYTNQIELSPFCTRKSLVKYCEDNSIIITAHSPLTKGDKLNDGILQQIASEYKVTTVDLLLQWSKQKKYIVIPRSSNIDHIIDNITCDFYIEHIDMNRLDELNCEYYTHPKFI